jgi:protein involved in polysaccharide export with SLBB domain
MKQSVLLFCAYLGLSACAGYTESVHAQNSGAMPRQSRLASGDGIRLRIYREPDISGDYLVDDRGIVVLPKIGEFKILDIPADSLRDILKIAYRRFLVSDAIEITPLRRVAVIGAVLRPGLYSVDPSMSISDAIILAGGVAQNGQQNKVELRKPGSTQGSEIPANTRVWNSGAGRELQIYVPLKPWAQRNGTLLVSVMFSTISTIGWLINMTQR